MNKPISESDLILNRDGSIYHLNLLPGELAETIILVGDPDRVSEVSKHFDRLEIKKQKREFVAHTGFIGKKHLSVISTGIGAGDIDIVINEVDALFNVDLVSRIPKNTHTKLNFIRLGTTGAAQSDIPLDSVMVAAQAFSFDGVLKFYADHARNRDESLFLALKKHFSLLDISESLVLTKGAEELIQKFSSEAQSGITFTCAGFYGPQGRQVRAKLTHSDLLGRVKEFSHENLRIINLEMETNLIYGLGKLLGHNCCSISTAVVNRIHNTASKNPELAIEKMIVWALEKISPL
jgi:uridine phosphorylase